jgi:hypothetical protein
MLEPKIKARDPERTSPARNTPIGKRQMLSLRALLKVGLYKSLEDTPGRMHYDIFVGYLEDTLRGTYRISNTARGNGLRKV